MKIVRWGVRKFTTLAEGHLGTSRVVEFDKALKRDVVAGLSITLRGIDGRSVYLDLDQEECAGLLAELTA